jgi:hypothetical protein
MVTVRQQFALKKMVENGGNISRAMVEAGYSPNTAKTPQKLTSSAGFVSLCEDNGLTDDFLLKALIEDIKEKKGNRKAELELGFKIKGHLVQKIGMSSLTNDKKITGMQIIFDDSFREKERTERINKLIDNYLVKGN